MTQLDNYVRAAIPDPYTILGVRLKPFCLGHYFLMQRFDCAFATDAKETEGGILDLLLGVAICSRSYEEFLDFIADDDAFNTWMKKWSAYITKEIKHNRKFNFLHKMIMFQEYMKNGVIIPQFFEEEEAQDAKTSGAHWTQSVLLVMTSELGYTHTEALNAPLSKVLADYFKFAEKSGMVSLMSDEELAMIESNKEEKSDGK